MSKSRARTVAFLVLLIGFPSSAPAWTDATRLRMIQDALRVTPPALEVILQRYRKELDRGVLAPSRREGEEVHFQHADGRQGLGAAAVVRKEKEVRATLLERRGLRRFVFEMGTLAHLVADVGFPLNASDDDPREPLYREAYRQYVERSLDKIPFVLARQSPAQIHPVDLHALMMATAREVGKSYELIGPAFKNDGNPRSRDALDERSVPFGIASLSYSRAVSDIVLVWRSLWASVDGDLSGTPYLDQTPGQEPKPEGDHAEDAPGDRPDRGVSP
jgi:hypothetical protein